MATAPPGLDEIDPRPDVWIPFQLDPHSNDQGHYFQVAGRLAPDVPLDQARAGLELSATSFRQKFPNAIQDNATFSVEPLGDAMVSNIRPTLFVLTGAVGLVLLVACANVANLLLVCATGRRREIAVRTAIGASRGRIIRQLLTESVVLAGTGGVVGLVLGFVGILALLAVDTAGLPRVGEGGAVVSVDWRVLLFTMGVALATSVIFGLGPALQRSRADLGVVLKERSSTGRRQNRIRAILVVAEVALALVLVVGSALLIRTAVALRQVDPGFDASRVLTMRMSMGDPRLASSANVEAMVRTGVERLRAVPGVAEASAACCVPLEGGYGLPFVIAGRPLEQGPFHGGGRG